MYQVNVDGKQEFQIEIDQSKVIIDGEKSDTEIHRISATKYQVFKNNRSYSVEVLNVDRHSKLVDLKINGKRSQVTLKTNLDQLLARLGMDQSASQSIKDLKAPMPGLILKINVSEGQEVEKGDPLLILEAMKMENVIKAQGKGVVKSVLVREKQSVEKNQVIVEFGS